MVSSVIELLIERTRAEEIRERAHACMYIRSIRMDVGACVRRMPPAIGEQDRSIIGDRIIDH